MKERETTRETLISMLKEMERGWGKISVDVRRSEAPLEKDSAEPAIQNENNGALDQLDNAARAERALIQHAIARIDAGEYGACQQCGEAINPERLLVLPYTRLGIRCAERAEI